MTDLRTAAQQALDSINELFAAEQSEGGERGGHIRTPATREHLVRVAKARRALHESFVALRDALEQQAEPVEPVAWANIDRDRLRVDIDEAITALRAALAQQAEPVDDSQPMSPEQRQRWEELAAMPQQAELDHETRAELAEQQVVQLAEERDHYRNLWRKARQAEPVAWADKISFENAMKTGKGHDVWPKAGDYETRTGRALIGLYTTPPQQSDPQTEDRLARHGIPMPGDNDER